MPTTDSGGFVKRIEPPHDIPSYIEAVERYFNLIDASNMTVENAAEWTRRAKGEGWMVWRGIREADERICDQVRTAGFSTRPLHPFMSTMARHFSAGGAEWPVAHAHLQAVLKGQSAPSLSADRVAVAIEAGEQRTAGTVGRMPLATSAGISVALPSDPEPLTAREERALRAAAELLTHYRDLGDRIRELGDAGKLGSYSVANILCAACSRAKVDGIQVPPEVRELAREAHEKNLSHEADVRIAALNSRLASGQDLSRDEMSEAILAMWAAEAKELERFGIDHTPLMNASRDPSPPNLFAASRVVTRLRQRQEQEGAKASRHGSPPTKQRTAPTTGSEVDDPRGRGQLKPWPEVAALLSRYPDLHERAQRTERHDNKSWATILTALCDRAENDGVALSSDLWDLVFDSNQLAAEDDVSSKLTALMDEAMESGHVSLTEEEAADLFLALLRSNSWHFERFNIDPTPLVTAISHPSQSNIKAAMALMQILYLRLRAENSARRKAAKASDRRPIDQRRNKASDKNIERYRRAAQSYHWACSDRPDLVPVDGKVYSLDLWRHVRENCDLYGDGNPPCPQYPTWCRYVREGLRLAREDSVEKSSVNSAPQTAST